MNFLGMGPLELLLILGLALIVIGPGKLPEVARQVAKTVGELRRVSNEVTREFQRSINAETDSSKPPLVRHVPPVAPPQPADRAQEPGGKGTDIQPPY